MPSSTYLGHSGEVYYTYFQQVVTAPGNGTTYGVENSTGYPVSVIFGQQAFSYWYPVFNMTNGTAINYYLQSAQVPPTSYTWLIITGIVVLFIGCLVTCYCISKKKKLKAQNVDGQPGIQPNMSLQPNVVYQPVNNNMYQAPVYYQQPISSPQFNYQPPLQPIQPVQPNLYNPYSQGPQYQNPVVQNNDYYAINPNGQPQGGNNYAPPNQNEGQEYAKSS